MSKGNMLLGHARGKVGSLVFSRANGKQITRALAEKVYNPQTKAQMIQRIIMQTSVQAYSKMAVICDHSFEGIKKGQDSMSYFIKNANKNLRALLAEVGDLDASEPTFVALGRTGFAVNPYVVSKGSLPVVTAYNVASGGFELPAAGNTYEAVINALGLQRGDQLTFLALTGTEVDAITFRYARVILDPRDVNGEEAPLTSAFVSGDEIAFPNPKNELYGLNFSRLLDNEFTIIKADGGAMIAAAAIIVSRKAESGEWKRSDATLVMAEDAEVGLSMQQALDEFESGGLEVVNPRYLNNASRSAANALSSAPAPAPATPHPLNISVLGQGSATVKNGNTVITDGSAITSGTTLSIEIVPAEDAVPTARINGNAVALQLSAGKYTGSFVMPAGSSTLVIDTGEIPEDGGM